MSFTAFYQGADVRLEWRTPEESEVQVYEVYRKKADESVYQKIGTLSANNSNNYSFIDDNLYKGSDAAQSISYRLTVKTTQNNYNLFASIQHTPTAVQRSWGSIKSMFK